MTGTAVLLSGGIDSYALTYQHKPDLAVTVDYGQSAAKAEIKSAAVLAGRLEIPHEVVSIDLRHLGSGDMSGKPALSVAPVSEWWPYRNQLLITIGAMSAIQHGVKALLIASVQSDSAHVDGSRAFMDSMDSVMRDQEGEMRILAPATHLTTQQLVRESGIPLSLLAWSHSCHTGDIACGQCRGCRKNQAVWADIEADETA